MKPINLKINTKTESYSIIIGSNIITKIKTLLKRNSIKFNKCLLVIDQKVPKKFITKLKKNLNNKEIYSHYIIANEKKKNFKTAEKILNFLLKKNFSRKDCLISVGGGITGDISGFAASLFKRGLMFINIPTTLLSQVDSSIGGKTGVNTRQGKNLIGSFYQPRLVLSDIEFLKSLPNREIICGYGEILKHSLIKDKKFFNFLNTNAKNVLNLKSPYIEKAIYSSCKIKKKIVEKDEKETELRKVLNFGHTFAHAYEAALGYSKKLNHGEAVLLGISSAIEFSYKKRILDFQSFKLIKNHLTKYNLPSNIKKYFSQKSINKILYFMLKDKKNNSKKINLILLKKISKTIINNYYTSSALKFYFKKELAN